MSASTDKAAYGAGEKPLLSLKVTNGGKVPCEVNIGTSQMEYMVTSGSDRIFSSDDCQAESTTWSRPSLRARARPPTSPGSATAPFQGCEPVVAKPGAGGAYYMFVARLGTKSSTKAVFQLN